MIRVEKLKRAYGAKTAVDELSFSVGEGKVVGFLGPNGAGKTTTLRILSGFIGPTSGRALIGGYDVTLEPRRVQSLLGYMPESCAAYPELRVQEYLRFRAQLKRVPSKRVRSAVEGAMARAGLAHRSEALVAHLSKGYKQRLGLADALVADPPLLVLDEPTSGLDPNQIREVRALIQELGRDKTILLSTHILSEVEASCDEALVIHQGRRVAQGTLAELRGLRESTLGELLLSSGSAGKDPTLGLGWEDALSGIASVEQRAFEGGRWRVLLRLEQPSSGLAPVLEKTVALGLKVQEARLRAPRLEDVFAELTQAEALGRAEALGQGAAAPVGLRSADGLKSADGLESAEGTQEQDV